MTTFEDYAAHGTTELDHLWDATHRAALADQLRKVYEESARNADDFNWHTVARRFADDVLTSVTWQLHGEVCDCDCKHCTVWSEIYSWLEDGDYEQRPYTLAELVAMWQDYTHA